MSVTPEQLAWRAKATLAGGGNMVLSPGEMATVLAWSTEDWAAYDEALLAMGIMTSTGYMPRMQLPVELL